MFSNVYDPTDMQEADTQRIRAYEKVCDARFAARWVEIHKQMNWASSALLQLKCDPMWHSLVKSDKLLQEAHDLLFMPGLPLRSQHMDGLNQYIVASRV